MSQNTARRDPHAKPEDADLTEPRTRQAEHKQVVRLRLSFAQPGPDGDVSPDEPDADEFELIGGIDDLGAADLGPHRPERPRPGRRFGATQEITSGKRARYRNRARIAHTPGSTMKGPRCSLAQVLQR